MAERPVPDTERVSTGAPGVVVGVGEGVSLAWDTKRLRCLGSNEHLDKQKGMNWRYTFGRKTSR